MFFANVGLSVCLLATLFFLNHQLVTMTFYGGVWGGKKEQVITIWWPSGSRSS